MKRYVLFAGKKYHPKGGMHDVVASADTIEELLTFYTTHNSNLREENYFNWGHIIDLASFEIVKEI